VEGSEGSAGSEGFRYVGQIRDSARSAPRNIAEGFSRFNPSEILPYVSWSKSSVHETENHFKDALESGYISKDEFDAIQITISRLISALLNWMKYLESPAARRFYEQHKAKRRASIRRNRADRSTR
jgi:four helix bundle protein